MTPSPPERQCRHRWDTGQEWCCEQHPDKGPFHDDCKEPGMPKVKPCDCTEWEYFYLSSIPKAVPEMEYSQHLNQFGRRGWELVCMDGSYFIFKRRL